MAPALLDLPHEVLHSIFANVNPPDVARLSCCKTLQAFLKTDRLLYKELYLRHYDDPLQSRGHHVELAWEEKLHELVKVGKILESTNPALVYAYIQEIVSAVEYLLQTASNTSETREVSWRPEAQNMAWLNHYFNNERQKRLLLSGSSLFGWANSSLRPHNFWPHCSMSDALPTEHIREQRDQTAASLPVSDLFPLPGLDEPLILPSIYTMEAPFCGVNEKSQLCAKLHCLYGVPIQDISGNSTRYHLRSSDAPTLHPFARSRVYDLRQHTDGTLWGPFHEEGEREVDWEKLEAIMVILGYNVKRLAKAREFEPNTLPCWSIPFQGAAPYSYISHPTTLPMEPRLPLESRDPYNVTGTWTRVICFLDYTEFYEFNFSQTLPPPGEPMPPLDTDEAVRLITMRLYITKIEEPGETDGKGLPVTWFRGESHSIRPGWDPNANSKIRGCVRLTPQGDVHWTTWSIFYGEERWRSEGIQVGGVQSARGVLGFWFDKDYDEHGPAGPTAFWKSHDGIEKKERSGRMSAQDLHALHIPLY